MSELVTTVADKIDRAVQRVTPFAYRMQRKGRRWVRRALRKPRSVAEGPNLLPLLIQVLASFFKSGRRSFGGGNRFQLGISALRLPRSCLLRAAATLPAGALRATGPLRMAQKLSAQLGADRKIMLGVQLYDLISQGGTQAGAGGRFLFLHVPARDGGPGNRHCLST